MEDLASCLLCCVSSFEIIINCLFCLSCIRKKDTQNDKIDEPEYNKL